MEGRKAMYAPLRRARPIVLALALGSAGASIAAAQQSAAPPPAVETADEAPFLTENSAAMNKMMADMAVQPSGDIDRDFAAMMIPHHQGAIDMAVAYLRHGTNEQLRRIAQEIVVEQQQEIAAMRLALGQPLSPSAAAQTQIGTGQPNGMHVHDHLSTGGQPASSAKSTK
jgi:uncharacterized protein (DUF305 family)